MNKNHGGKTPAKPDKNPIAYQNKDSTAKVLADLFRGKSFEAYGLTSLPDIKDVRPTNLPAIEANELKLDNLFYFEDDSIGILDYESVYAEQNKVKYFNYIARILKRVYNEEKRFRKLRLIIIYTGDVKRGSTIPHLDLEGVSLTLTEAFLSDLPGKEVRKRIERRLNQGLPLTDQDLMQLIIFPLSFEDNDQKRRAVGKAIDLAEKIPDQSQMYFALAGIGVFAEKVISSEDFNRIKRRLGMVKIFESIIEEAVEEAVEKTEKRAKADGRKQGWANAQKEIARNFLRTGSDREMVARNTGLSLKQVAKLQKGSHH